MRSPLLVRPPVRVSIFAIAATAFPFAAPGPVAAQEVTELPAIEVTTPSPVAKPKRKARPSVQPGTGAPAPALDAAEDEVAVPPGTALDFSAAAFVAVTVASEREIAASGGQTLTDVLEHKPGIVGSAFAPGANRPIIRGLDSYRVRTQENGIGTHDVAAISEDHAVPVDPNAADRIEVVRGPATLRYGSQAIGGVVAVENERIPTFVPEGGVRGVVKGGATSVDESADAAFNVTAGAKATGFVVHADGFARRAEDYGTPRGREINTFVDSAGGAIGLSRVWSGGFLGVAFTHIESLYGIPGEEAREGVLPRIDMEQQKILARGEWRVRDSGVEAVRFWFGASAYEHQELANHGHGGGHDHDDDHDDDHDTAEGFEIHSRFRNAEQEARLEVQHVPVGTLLGRMSGAVGVHLSHRETSGIVPDPDAGESLLEPAETQSIAAFWFEELDLTDTLRLQAATRLEHTTVDGSGWEEFHGHLHGDHGHFEGHAFQGQRSFTPVSGSLGLLYRLPFDTVARLNGQYVERAPDAAELFSKGMHEATGTFEVGNPVLEVERATTAEVGLRKSTGTLRFDASAYYTRYNGFIYRELQGLVCDPVAHGGEFDCVEAGHDHDHGDAHRHMFDLVRFEQRDADFYGFEAAAEVDVAAIWNGLWGIEGQYDFVHARFDGGGYVPRIPPHRLGGGLYYRDARWYARVGLLHAFAQDRIGDDEELTTPGHTLVSAELAYTVPGAPGTPGFTLGLKGENLADAEVLNHASFKRREGVLEPGASVRLFGSITLN